MAFSLANIDNRLYRKIIRKSKYIGSDCGKFRPRYKVEGDDHHEENDLNVPIVANDMTNPPFPGQEREKVPDSSAPQDASTAVSDLSEGESSPCLSPTQDDKDCKPASLQNETELAGRGHSEVECGFPTGMETSNCTKHSSHICPVYTPVFHNRTLFTSATSTQHSPQQAKSSCMDNALPWQPLLLTGTFPSDMQELVLKVRVQNTKENDFIEIELNRHELTYPELLRVSCCELDINPKQVQTIRKLPNTLVRKDKDVARLQDYQELELVLGGKYQPSAATLTEKPCYNNKAASLTY
uniref:ankyrin repeat domain-containing protein 40-like n=1 Tax=Euleptes europaea TaxID=460621 RepID=UPI00253FCE6E|nr:ankyrin repeat domain-containing protein 40-like [Euleptes europaea]